MEPTLDQITVMIFTAVITGGFSAASTVIGLKVHINYLKDAITRHESEISKAHERIDDLQKVVNIR